ncbi:MAG: hypothetical protein LBT37_01705, partial [Lactobacillaceae bacterium]|nr:hypothetical protein [Lactobacillaceae bacterium]
QAGAQIPKGHVISVSLAAGQTFSAAYDESTTVPYKVKINTNPGIANTTGGAVSVLTANADVAHDTGATAIMKVGFDSAPTFKYAGTYSDSVQFEVRAGVPAPAPGTSIFIGGVEFNYVKEQNGKALVVMAGSAGESQYQTDPTGNYKAYYESLIEKVVNIWFKNTFDYENAGSEDTITIDGYTIYKTTLNGATTNVHGGFEDTGFQNQYLSVPAGSSGTNAITAYAFVVSKADINAQSVSNGGYNTAEGSRVANGASYTVMRSPGENSDHVALMSPARIYDNDVDFSAMPVKPALWIDMP